MNLRTVLNSGLLSLICFVFLKIAIQSNGVNKGTSLVSVVGSVRVCCELEKIMLYIFLSRVKLLVGVTSMVPLKSAASMRDAIEEN